MNRLFKLPGQSAPFGCYVPQSVKIYPLHQLLPTSEPPRMTDWNPSMAPATRRYLGAFPADAAIGRQLYMHIPFCPAFCHFCCLYKTMKPDEQSPDFIEGFVRHLLLEIEAYGRVPAAHLRKVTSIYFGGGTPSMLKPAQVERILVAIRKHLPIASGVEISFEGMAHQLKDRDYLRALAANGVNRVSYGVQTFQPELRKQLGRIDTVEDVFAAAESVRATPGIPVLNFELLMGIPGQSREFLLDDLACTVRAAPDSVDVLFYNAVPGTRYYAMIRDGVRPPQLAGQRLLALRREAIAFLEHSGFHHATGEIFDRAAGHLDNFNETHYGGATGLDEMLALGPSSYGFLDGVSYQNVASVAKYIELVAAGKLPVRACRSITIAQARRRGLLFGIQLGRIRREVVRSSMATRVLLGRWTAWGLCDETAGGWTLTAEGKVFYNMMQLEAMPLLEAGLALDLALDPTEQKRLLFQPAQTRGNVELARELERLIEGPIPGLRTLRRGFYRLLAAAPLGRSRLSFTGPVE